MKQLQPGVDPRTKLKAHKERGPKKHFYTYEDLSVLFKMSVVSVRKAVSRKRFDPNNLESICQYWLEVSMRRVEPYDATAGATDE